MRFLRWLYRLPGRLDRSLERTAAASSVVQSEGMGGSQPSALGVTTALGEIEQAEPEEERADDSGDAEGSEP